MRSVPVTEISAIRLIKRYGNRKLYDTLESRYITLEDIARLVRSSNDVKVIDNESGDDLTTITFAQIILEEEKRRSSLLSLGLLRDLIQHGEHTLADLRSRVEKGVEAFGSMVSGAVSGEHRETPHAGTPESPKPEVAAKGGFLDELLSAPQRRLEELQKSIDERIKSSVGRITGHPAFQHEVQRIERSIKKLEDRIARLRREEVGGPPNGATG